MKTDFDIVENLDKNNKNKHGRWLRGRDGRLICSVCLVTAPYADTWNYVTYTENLDYCPNCGAKMDEKVE